MGKFYYTSSSGDIYDSDGELYHFGWKKKDAKYIKRERKNGKWVYTYKDDSKGSVISGKVDATSKSVGDAVNKAGNKAGNKAARQVWFNKAKDALSDVVENANDKRETRKAERKKDWEESKQRSAENAAKEAAAKGQTFKDSDDLLSSETKIYSYRTHGGKVVEKDLILNEQNRGKIDRFADTAKEYIKDRLGYDEREALNKASAKYEYAQTSEKNYQDIAAIASFNMGKTNPYDGSVTYTKAEKRRIEEMERHKQLHRELTTKAGKEASEAADAYFNTPIGKLEKTYNTGKKWLEKLFGKKR